MYDLFCKCPIDTEKQKYSAFCTSDHVCVRVCGGAGECERILSLGIYP